jgi:hypothetical protein
MRAQKFGVELSGDAKKEARAARFGVSAPINTGNTAVSIIGSVSVACETHVMGTLTLSNPVFLSPDFSCSRRFSSCSTDFSQQIVQVVLFLFLLMFLSFKTVG